MKHLVILDAGHGLDTNGKRTPLFPNGSFMRENEFNRSVIRKIDLLLEANEDIDVVFVNTEKRDISLNERVVRVNELYEKVKHLYDKIILVSVHANAYNGVWGSQNGTSTHYYPTNEVDKAFAQAINKNLVEKIGLKNRGNIGGDFQILREVKCTACLVECGFMDNLEEAKLLLSEEFRQDCAKGIVDGILKYLGVRDIKVEYKKYGDGTLELKGTPLDLDVKIVNKSNRSIEESYCVNGTFFWYEDVARTKTYPTSILVIDGKIYQNEANHLQRFGTPQSVFIVYNNGQVDMKRVKYATELDYKNIKVAVGGVGLRNTLDPVFKYNPYGEGFRGAYADVLRKTSKTVIGYNKTNGKLYLLARPNTTHGNLIKIISDNSTGEAYDIALSLDGGGSTFFNNLTDMVLKGDGRRIHNIIGFNL